jgi:hypothetical protein
LTLKEMLLGREALEHFVSVEGFLNTLRHGHYSVRARTGAFSGGVREVPAAGRKGFIPRFGEI